MLPTAVGRHPSDGFGATAPGSIRPLDESSDMVPRAAAGWEVLCPPSCPRSCPQARSRPLAFVAMSSRARLIQGMYLTFVGLAFAVVGVITLGDPRYWDATTPFDYAAVWTHSLVLLLVAPALIILVRRARGGTAATVVAWIVAAGAVLALGGQRRRGRLPPQGLRHALRDRRRASTPTGCRCWPSCWLSARARAFALVPAAHVRRSARRTTRGGGILIGVTWAILRRPGHDRPHGADHDASRSRHRPTTGLRPSRRSPDLPRRRSAEHRPRARSAAASDNPRRARGR